MTCDQLIVWDYRQIGYYTSDDWAEGSADADWRAAAYERAATRPCTGYGYRTHKGFRPNHCWTPGKSNPGPQSSCGGTS